MSDCRDLIAEEKGMEQYCHCQSCGSKAELNENSEGTLWYKCTECGWFGLKYSEVVEELKEKCEYCEVDVDDRKSLLVVETDFYNYEIYVDGNNNLTHYDMFEDNKINYCPMCGRKL